MLVELHCHSRFSDGLSTVENIMIAAAKRLGAIAVTDHNTLNGYKVAKRLKMDIIVIPGAEISSQEGHIIALGISEYIKPHVAAMEIIDSIHAQGGIAIAAHPFGGLTRPGIRDAEILHSMDAIEVLNGGTLMKQNMQALALAKELKMPVVSGSDAHMLKNVGSFACMIDASDIDSILNAIKKGDVRLPKRNTNTAEIILDKTWHAVSRLF